MKLFAIGVVVGGAAYWAFEKYGLPVVLKLFGKAKAEEQKILERVK